MLEIIAPITGAFIFLLLAGILVDKYIQRISQLSEVKEDKDLIGQMNRILFVPTVERRPNKLLGFGERILFFIAFNSAQPLIAASWLAFKLASKWQTWNSVIKFPEDLELADPPKEFEIRNRYGTNLLQRWLIGTIANILLGYVAFVLAAAIGRAINA